MPKHSKCFANEEWGKKMKQNVISYFLRNPKAKNNMKLI